MKHSYVKCWWNGLQVLFIWFTWKKYQIDLLTMTKQNLPYNLKLVVYMFKFQFSFCTLIYCNCHVFWQMAWSIWLMPSINNEATFNNYKWVIQKWRHGLKWDGWTRILRQQYWSFNTKKYTLWHTTYDIYWFYVEKLVTFVYKIKLFVVIWIATA